MIFLISHQSNAERLYQARDMRQTAREFLRRAEMAHSVSQLVHAEAQTAAARAHAHVQSLLLSYASGKRILKLYIRG